MPIDHILAPERVRIHPGSATREEAMREAADLLVAAGAVTDAYYEAMLDRERTVGTFMGSGLAMPHGTYEARTAVLGSALTFVRYDGGVDWGGQHATFVVGVAGNDGEHLELLAQIAVLFSDEIEVDRLRAARTAEQLFALIAAAGAA